MTDEISSAAEAAPDLFPSPSNPDPHNASPFVAAARGADARWPAGGGESVDERRVSFGGGVRHEAVARRQTSAAVPPPEPSAPSTGMRRVSDGIVGGCDQRCARALDPGICRESDRGLPNQRLSACGSGASESVSPSMIDIQGFDARVRNPLRKGRKASLTMKERARLPPPLPYTNHSSSRSELQH